MKPHTKKITLISDEKLIEAARERTRAKHTTLNEQFRRWPRDYVRRDQQVKEARKLLDHLRTYVRTEGKKFTRDEMNER
jgi:hypothetical protein